MFAHGGLPDEALPGEKVISQGRSAALFCYPRRTQQLSPWLSPDQRRIMFSCQENLFHTG
jgi:hypothetical protein